MDAVTVQATLVFEVPLYQASTPWLELTVCEVTSVQAPIPFAGRSHSTIAAG